MSGGGLPEGGTSGRAGTGDRLVEVCTGEVATGDARDTLVASALGSCVAVAALDRTRRIGAIAHVMLPGAAPPGPGESALRYAENAVEELLGRLLALGSPRGELEFFLAGGGNVLERADDGICARNIESVLGILGRQGLRIAAASLGGTLRRKLVLEVAAGRVLCAVGDGPGVPLAEAGA